MSRVLMSNNLLAAEFVGSAAFGRNRLTLPVSDGHDLLSSSRDARRGMISGVEPG